MIAWPVAAPRGPVPFDRQTSWNPPANHSHDCDVEILPPGPIGDALASPWNVHWPAKYAMRLCSGPGFICGACAMTVDEAATTMERMPRTTKVTAAARVTFMAPP